MSEVFNRHQFENIVGISLGATMSGINIAAAHTGCTFSNLSGYNMSSTGSTSAAGIKIAGPPLNSGDDNSGAVLSDSLGKSNFYGNGIIAYNVELKKCTGIAPSTDPLSLETPSIFSFVVGGQLEMSECTSMNGNINSYPMNIRDAEGYNFPNNTNITDSNLSTDNKYCIIVEGSTSTFGPCNLKIRNSVIKSSTVPILYAEKLGTLEIDGSVISSNSGLNLPYGSSINNNSITVGSTSSFPFAGATSIGVLSSFSNNSIRGGTTTNGGSIAVNQSIITTQNQDSFGNIVYGIPHYTGLVAYYDFNNTASWPNSGSTVFDISQNGLIDATNFGAIYNSSDGGSFVLDGTDYVRGATSTTLLINTEITLEAFIKTTNVSTSTIIINNNSNQGYRLSLASGGNLEFIANFPAINYSSPSPVPFNQWCHVVATHGPNGGKLYVNGAIVNSIGTPYSNGAPATFDYLLIGQLTGNTARFIGNIGVVRVYNKQLNDVQVTKNFNADRARFGI